MEIPRQNLISFRIPFIWKGNPWCSELERIFTAADLKSVTTLTQIPRPTAEIRINMGLIHVKTATFIKSASKICVEVADFRRLFRAVCQRWRFDRLNIPLGWGHTAVFDVGLYAVSAM